MHNGTSLEPRWTPHLQPHTLDAFDLATAPELTASEILLGRLRVAFEAARDAERAAAATAYMRNLFPFMGIRMPELAVIYRDATADLPPPTGDAELAAVALACWEPSEREYQYIGTTHLQRHVRRATPGFVPTLERLVTTRSWWDTVDALATNVAGPLVSAYPALRAVTDRWVESENIWLARTAILHQDRYRERIDPDLLFAYCLRRAGDREFFIRKAIGWALRSYAKVRPEAVARFLTEHGDALSGLSRREAERGVAMGRAAAGRTRRSRVTDPGRAPAESVGTSAGECTSNSSQ